MQVRRGQLATAVLAGVAVALLVRLSSARRHGPRVTDEIGYLLNARVIADEPGGDLSCCAVYAGGWSILGALTAALTRTPEAFYQGALLLNALLAGAVLPVAYLVARQGLQVRHGAALAAAVSAAAVPGLVVNANYAWTEPLLALLLLSVLACWSYALTSQTCARAAPLTASSLLVAWAVTTHPRMLPLAFAQVVLLVVVHRLRRAGALPAGIAGVVLVLGLGAGWLLNRHLQAVSWPNARSSVHLASAQEKLGGTDVLGQVLLTSTGQLWYLSASTGCLALTGILIAGWMALRVGSDLRSRAVGLIVCSTALGIASVVSLSLGDISVDPTYVVYGRYVEVVAPAAVCIAVATLLAKHRTAVVAACVAAASTVLVGYWLAQSIAGTTTRQLSIVGLVALMPPGAVTPVRASVLAATLLAGVLVTVLVGAAAARRRSARQPDRSNGTTGMLVPTLVAAALVTAATWSAGSFLSEVTLPAERVQHPDGWTLAQESALSGTAPVGVLAPDNGAYSMTLHALPGRAVRTAQVGTLSDEVLVVLAAAGLPVPTGWRLVQSTPDGSWDIWERR